MEQMERRLPGRVEMQRRLRGAPAHPGGRGPASSEEEERYKWPLFPLPGKSGAPPASREQDVGPSAGDRMQTAITALVTASKGNDEAAIKTAIGGVAKTCSACHDSFRQKP